jgi:hypothetical protein
VRAVAGDERRRFGTWRAAGVTALVQPRVTSIESIGEYPLVFLAGQYSHAALRRVSAGPDGVARSERSRPHRPDAGQLAVARAAMDYISRRFGTPTYARLDIVNDDRTGSPRILEVELVEPSLFIPEGEPEAPGRLADALITGTRSATVPR